MKSAWFRPGFWFAWHRRLGLIFGFALLLWAASGVLHPIISRIGPQPLVWKPEVMHTMGLPAPAQLACLQGITQLAGARLFSWQGSAVWQFSVNPNQPRVYCDAQTGRVLPDGEQRWAQDLARQLLGNTSAIKTVERIIAFGPRYLEINRILPAYRVQFADGVSAYVDPNTSQLTGSSNAAKGLGMQTFRWLHTWAFLPKGWVVNVWMTVLLTALFTGAVLGCCWLWRVRRSLSSRPKYVLFHAWLGAGLMLPLTAWCLSGVWHVWAPKVPTSLHGPEVVVELAQLKQMPMLHGITEWVLLPYGQALWRSSGPAQASGEHDHQRGMRHKSTVHYFNLDGQAVEDKRALLQLAQTLVTLYQPQTKVDSVEIVTRYGDEYGFIFKRLPVLKVPLNDGAATVLYLDPVSGALAAQINRSARWEGYAFSWLHKWHWLDHWASKTARDSALAIGAGLLCLLGVLGLVRGVKRRVQKTQST